MADGKIDIEIDLNSSKASSKAPKVGKDLADKIDKGVKDGLKNVEKSVESAAKGIEKPLKGAADSAKSSFDEVGNAAKSSFGDVGDAAKTASGDASSAFQTIPADASGSFSDVSSQAESGFSGVADAAETASADAAGSFEQIGEAAEEAFEEVGESAEGAGDDIQGVFGSKIPSSTVIATAAIAAVTAAVVDVAKKSIETGAEFDKSMSQVAATMGVTTDQVGELRDFAQQMGETTAFSASQAAEALNYMALAGYDADTSMRVLPTVLNLAAAGSMDLARASDMVTDAQSALGLSIEDTEAMVDQMAKTSSKTNTSVEQLGDAFLTVGGTAKNLKGGTQELSQMLGILADNGIKGSEGGTALRNVILSLSAPTDTAAQKMKELGLEVFDAEGNMRSMPDIFNDLNSAMEPLTQQEKTDALNTIFNKVDLKSANALLGTSADRFDEVADAIANAQGSAQKMAETQLDNLAGDVTLLESATEGFFIAVSDQLSPALRNLTQFGTNTLMPFLTNVVKNFDKIAPAILGVIIAITTMYGRSKLIKLMGTDTANLTKKVTILGREFKLTGTAAKIGAVGVNGLKTAFKALKSVGVVLAFSAIVEVISMLIGSIQEAKKKQEDYNAATSGLVDAATGVSSAVKDEADAFDSLSDATDGVNFDDMIQRHKDLAASITESNQGVIASKGMLDEYAKVIDELDGTVITSESDLARFQVAVDGINDSMGTNYTIVQGADGAYRIMADGVEVAKDKMLELIEAQKIQLQLDALKRQYEEAYDTYSKDLDEVAKATDKVTEAEEALKEAEENLQGARYTYDMEGNYVDRLSKEQKAVNDAKDALQKATEAEKASEAAKDKIAEKQIFLTEALNESASAFTKAAANNDKFMAGVQSADVDLAEFTKALQDMGFTADDVANLSVEDAKAMAEGWKSGTDELITATEKANLQVPDKLRQMGTAAKTEATNAGKEVPKGISDGIDQNIEVAKGAIDYLVTESQSKLDELDGETPASDAMDEWNAVIEGNVDKTKILTGYNVREANYGLSRADGKTPAGKMMADYDGQIKAAVPITKAKSKENADTAEKELNSKKSKSKTWGSDLVGNFIDGIGSMVDKAGKAAKSVIDSVASFLHFSQPDQGAFSGIERGGITSGKHLVQNFAEGMLSARSEVRNAASAIAVDINEALMSEMMAIDPMAQLSESMKRGSTALNMSAMLAGAAPSYTTNEQNLNFYGDYQSPDIIAREMRMQQHYGLAGRFQ